MTITRARKHNLTAASWSANGGSIETGDLRDAANHPFGANVFSPAVQKERLVAETFDRLNETLASGAALDPVARRRGRRGDEGVGPRARGDPLHPHVPAADRPHRREARLVLRAGRRLRRDRRLLRQGADPGRARRLVVPDRRHPRHLRGARLHRLGPDEPGVPAREPERRPALHPDRVRVVDRRGARREDPAAALDGRALELGREGAAPARRRGRPSASSRPSAPSRSTS